MKAIQITLVALVAFLMSCNQGPPKNSRAAQAMRGKAFFMENCTGCHGPNANKELVATLESPPRDLAKIMKRRRTSTFPIVEIASYIDGRRVLKHHKRDMPAWGKYFEDEEKLTDHEIKGKMGELIAYLMTIQE